MPRQAAHRPEAPAVAWRNASFPNVSDEFCKAGRLDESPIFSVSAVTRCIAFWWPWPKMSESSKWVASLLLKHIWSILIRSTKDQPFYSHSASTGTAYWSRSRLVSAAPSLFWLSLISIWDLINEMWGSWPSTHEDSDSHDLYFFLPTSVGLNHSLPVQRKNTNQFDHPNNWISSTNINKKNEHSNKDSASKNGCDWRQWCSAANLGIRQ